MEGTVEYVHLQPGAKPPPLPRAPSRVLVVLSTPVEPAWQARVSTWLIQLGCLYMLAWGPGCSTWDNSVDTANGAAFGFGEIPDDAFCMTTWHENESLKEFMWFAKNCGHHPDVELTRTLLIHIGSVPRPTELAAAYAEA